MKYSLLFIALLSLSFTLHTHPAKFDAENLDCKLFINRTDSIELFDTIGNKLNDKVMRVTGGNPDADVLSGYIRVKNNTSTSLKIYVKRKINQEVNETANWFCFGPTCYGPMTDSSLSVTTIAPGVTDLTFYGDYSPSGLGGLTSITYEFYDKQTFPTRISAKATVEFSISAVACKEEKFFLRGPYPNPSSEFTEFEYNLPSDCKNPKLIIRSMLGVEINSQKLEGISGIKKIDISNYQPGVYFFSIILDGKILQTRKMVIRH